MPSTPLSVNRPARVHALPTAAGPHEPSKSLAVGIGDTERPPSISDGELDVTARRASVADPFPPSSGHGPIGTSGLLSQASSPDDGFEVTTVENMPGPFVSRPAGEDVDDEEPTRVPALRTPDRRFAPEPPRTTTMGAGPAPVARAYEASPANALPPVAPPSTVPPVVPVGHAPSMPGITVGPLGGPSASALSSPPAPPIAVFSASPHGGPMAPAARAATILHAAGGPPPARPPSIVGGVSIAPGLPLTRLCTSCDARYPSDFLVCPRDATPLVDEAAATHADPLVGTLIGDTYQIVRVVGEGGMGRVYEARHLRLKERRFAVKTLHADLARSPEIVARFMREAESASSLSHPHVVDVFDVHHLSDGTPYLVGEFLDGEELAVHVAKRGPLAPAMVAAIGRQVCSALAAAHANGIVHRDMKPENVFVMRSSIEAVDAGRSREIHCKVLDFGISKAGGERTHLTRTGVIMGTPSYMSPEQARGRSVDHRADVYSLGAVLYFALTGRRPFDSDDPTSTLSMVLTQDPLRPRAIDPRIPEALEMVVQRAMAKEPADRHPSMMDLAKALELFDGSGEHAALGREFGKSASLAPVGSGTRASRAFDAAKMILGAGPTPEAMQAGNLTPFARPTIVVASSVLGLWLVGGTTAALAGLVRVLHEGEVTLTESVLLVVGCLFASLTPAVLYVLHVRRTVWPNSVKSLQLASDLRRAAMAALVTYGGVSIVARIVHTVFLRNSKALTSGGWDIALLLVSVFVAVTLGGVAPLARNLRRRP